MSVIAFANSSLFCCVLVFVCSALVTGGKQYKTYRDVLWCKKYSFLELRFKPKTYWFKFSMCHNVTLQIGPK